MDRVSKPLVRLPIRANRDPRIGDPRSPIGALTGDLIGGWIRDPKTGSPHREARGDQGEPSY